MPSPEKSISLHALIETGVILAPCKIYGLRGGMKIDATITSDGMIHCNGKIYNSPSVSAGQAITALTKETTSNRSYASINGWLFWQLVLPDGSSATLAELRSAAREKLSA